MMPPEPPLITRRRARGALPGMPSAPSAAQPAQDVSAEAPAARPPTVADPVERRIEAEARRDGKARRRPPTRPAEENDVGVGLASRATLTRAGASSSYMITIRLPEPLHQRYRRLIRALGSENTPTTVTEIVHALLKTGPLSPAGMRALVRRWRALLDVGLDEAPHHPYLGAGRHATTLRVDAALRDQAMGVIGELEDQCFRTNLNEVLQALLHFGPTTPAEARRLLEDRLPLGTTSPSVGSTGDT
jgi:hypothetical protein